MTTLPISDLLAEHEILALQAPDFSANSTNSWRGFSTRATDSEKESLGQKTWAYPAFRGVGRQTMALILLR